MGNETRATMIEGAIQLLATRGVHGASLLKVLEHTGAPRGSVYHHFPGGKEELILAALDLTGQRHDRFVDQFPRHIRGPRSPPATSSYGAASFSAPDSSPGAPSSPLPSPYPRVRYWTGPERSSGPLNSTSPTSTKKSVSTDQPQSAS